MFAIVDIETTGGHASANGITEVAILLHNGHEVEGRFETLINPEMPIQPYVQSLTGITDNMVASAPVFGQVAEKIFNLLKNRVFVAHNVNFDYSFVRHHLLGAGYELDVQKLCTIRLSRRIFPGFRRYGLGSICSELNIPISDRHRAAGDAIATARLFELLLLNDKTGELSKLMKGRGEQYLPPNLAADKLVSLPLLPGVYYFHDKKGKIIYVGKAKALRQRVTSHFSNNKPTRQKQDFLRRIYDITHQVCGSELMAAVRESVEIRKHWPEFNKSQKAGERVYGIYSFEDGKGYTRLAIDQKKKYLEPLHSFTLLEEGRQLLLSLVKQFDLCPRLCFIDLTEGANLPQQRGETAGVYNGRVALATDFLREWLPSFAVIEKTHDHGMNACALVEKGSFRGIGEIPSALVPESIGDLRKYIEPLPESAYIRSLLYTYAEKNPDKKFMLKD